MKYEDCESSVSKYVSKAIKYFESSNPAALMSLAMSICWIVAGIVVISGASPLYAGMAMLFSYLITRTVDHFDKSTERQAKTGIYIDIQEHDPSDEYMCTECAEYATDGNLRRTYKVLYILDYEIARKERTRNLVCKSCEQNIQTEKDKIKVEN
jgi:hypothetical protein